MVVLGTLLGGKMDDKLERYRGICEIGIEGVGKFGTIHTKGLDAGNSIVFVCEEVATT